MLKLSIFRRGAWGQASAMKVLWQRVVLLWKAPQPLAEDLVTSA